MFLGPKRNDICVLEPEHLPVIIAFVFAYGRMLLEIVGNNAKCAAAVSTGALRLHCSADPHLNCKMLPCNHSLAKLRYLSL